MKIHTLEDLFVEQLRDIYYAEHQLAKNMPDMAKNATDPSLKKAFEKHLEETKGQILVLEDVMQSLDLPIKAEKCEAIDGLLKEAKELMENAVEPVALDAALVLAAQKIEHYEIATYGCLCAFANRLGFIAQAKKLHSILEQERRTDEILTSLAESDPGLNTRAQAA
jgi:ferritin-like metal-binding protein YciE